MARGSPSLIDFVKGWPHPSLLPTELLTAASRAVLADPEIFTSALQYGDDPGFQPLREALATWLHGHFNVDRDPERICISGGASQNIASILQSFTDPNVTRAVWLTAPTYHLVSAIFDDSGFNGRLKAFPEDEHGPDLQHLERALEQFDSNDEVPQIPIKDLGPHRKSYRHIIYVVPTCANPSGKTMPLHQRQELIRLARRHDALIISDDVYDFLQWPFDVPESNGEVRGRCAEMKLPRFCDIDLAMPPSPTDPGRFGYAISNGSFSKLVGPGLRTGWLEGSRAFAFGLAQTGSTKSGGSPSQFSAAILANMLDSGALQDHLATVVLPGLQNRHMCLTDAIDRYLVPLGVTYRRTGLVGGEAYGGYFVWLTLPRGQSADAVADECLKKSVIVGRGTMFAIHRDEKAVDLTSNLRLAFSFLSEDELVEGVRRLAKVLSMRNV